MFLEALKLSRKESLGKTVLQGGFFKLLARRTAFYTRIKHTSYRTACVPRSPHADLTHFARVTAVLRHDNYSVPLLVLTCTGLCSTGLLSVYGHDNYIWDIQSQALIVQDGPLAFLLGVSVITHIFRHTVGLLWTSDRPVSETSTYAGQHNIETQQTNFHAPSGSRNRDRSNKAAADLSLRPRDHWDRQIWYIVVVNVYKLVRSELCTV
jgi:hypothetical protein